MGTTEERVRRASGIHGAIASDLAGLGGILRCTVCGREQGLGDIGQNLAHGWPKCHNYTMTWVTQRLLDEETALATDQTNERSTR